ncbi:MAG: winged helix-turn-helix transcriptional regulator [Sedimentisphaerales bacterium]|nr:winged helix-turn-helix transcriptional regulator [Sedimentisphaerales bacterium]
MKRSHSKWALMCEILKPLAYSARLEMLSLLDNEDTSIQQMSLKSKQSESVVSRHLRLLHNSGLARRTQRGHRVFYRLDTYACDLEV